MIMETQEYYYDDDRQVRPQPFSTPNNQYGSSITVLTNPENELYKMELSLRNMMLDKDGNPKQIGQPLMNEDGVCSVVGQVQTIVSQITIMSNFDKREEIKEIYDRIRNRHPEYALPESSKLIGLEETHELFNKAGFKKTRIFGIHQIDYIDSSKYFAVLDAPSSFWRVNMLSDVSSELIEMVNKEIREEMIKVKTDKNIH